MEWAPRKNGVVKTIEAGDVPTQLAAEALSQEDINLIITIVSSVIGLASTIIGILFAYGVIKGPGKKIEFDIKSNSEFNQEN